MAINQDVYGRPEQWLDTYYQPDALTNKNKKAFFADAGVEASSMLFTGVANDKLSYEIPIDNTLSYCGLGTECALSHISYIGTNPEDTTAVTIIHTQDRDITNFSFFEKNGGNLNASSYNTCCIQVNELNKLIWTENFTNRNNTPYLAPYTVVNPHNIVLLIYVYCRSAQGSTINTTLQAYIDNNYKDTYPQIISAYVVALFGNLTVGRGPYGGRGTPSSYQIPFIIGLLDNYEIPSKSLDVSIYYWYANVVYGSQQFNNVFIDYDAAGNYITPCYTTERGKEHIKCGTDGSSKYLYIEYYDGIIEDILSTVACFGLFFTGDVATAQSGALTDPKMYVGLLDENGIGHGLYYQGSENIYSPQYRNDWQDMAENSGYDPSAQYIDYDTQSHYGTINYAKFNRMYSLTQTQVEDIYRIMSEAMADKPADVDAQDYSVDVFLTNNPIDCVISIRKYPIVDTSGGGNNIPVKFGGYVSDILAPYAKDVQTIQYTFDGSKKFVSEFGGSFLDRDPYTKADLFIPFCGNVKISVDEYIDHVIGVKLIVDYITGSCTAYIERDGIPRQTITGNIGLDIPVTGVQTQTLANTLLRNSANLKAAQINVQQSAARAGASIASGVGGLITGNVSGGINAAAAAGAQIGNTELAMQSRDMAAYQLHHTEIPFKSVSPGEALTAGFGEWRCRLTIIRPEISTYYNADTYARTIGYACLINCQVKDLHGLTAGTIDLSSIDCTQEEKAMIYQAFKRGVYLPNNE